MQKKFLKQTQTTEKLLTDFINIVHARIKEGKIDDDIIRRFINLIKDDTKLKTALYFL